MQWDRDSDAKTLSHLNESLMLFPPGAAQQSKIFLQGSTISHIATEPNAW